MAFRPAFAAPARSAYDAMVPPGAEGRNIRCLMMAEGRRFF